MNKRAIGWLYQDKPLLSSFLAKNDWRVLEKFEDYLKSVASSLPKSGIDLLDFKKDLAKRGFGGVDVPKKYRGLGRSSLLQMLIQFVCGYYDLDLRDSAHIAHGRMILKYGSPAQKSEWLNEVVSGELVGIASTEKQGGTNLEKIRTTARNVGTNRWLLKGEKRWISRIDEARVFIVFFKIEGSDEMSAALLNPKDPNIEKVKIRPSGLRGWSWGRLIFKNVEFRKSDFLYGRNKGLEIFRDHFLYYRPMVSATCLGSAAWAFDFMTSVLKDKFNRGYISRYSDSALETMGKSYMLINSSLLASINACLLVGQSNVNYAWSRGIKALGVDNAYKVVADLSILAGARAYQKDSRIAKVHRDLRAFLYADGIQDSLYRSSGRLLVEE